jgi:hypothetical protein
MSPYAKVFEHGGISRKLKFSKDFLQFFLAELDCFIDLRFNHDKRIYKIDIKGLGCGSLLFEKDEPY